MSFQNSKKTTPSRGTIWLLCVAFLLFTAAAHLANQDISWLLSGVHQIIHKERYLVIELILKYSNFISVLYVIYVLFGLRFRYQVFFALCFLPHIFFFITSIIVFFIDNMDMHLHINRERFVVNTVSIFILLLISENYKNRIEV